MKAVILIGGFATRLQPLALIFSTPLVDFANKPMILHQIEAFKNVSVTEVILPDSYPPEVMVNFLKDFDDTFGIKITSCRETEPLDTAGPLALAKDKLVDGSGDPFFVLNSNVISEYPFAELIQFHKSHGGEATIMVTKVDKPSTYGVVMDEDSGRVDRCVEKSEDFVGNKFNAGIYLLNPSVLDRIELRPTSIEKEVFPKLASDRLLYAMVLPGFWMDIGEPKDYLTGQGLYLAALRKNGSTKFADGYCRVGNVLIHENAVIGEECVFGPDVAIGPGCVIEHKVKLSRCTVMQGAHIKKNSYIINSIIGRRSIIGQRAYICHTTTTIIGEDVHVSDEACLRGGFFLS